MFFTFLNFPNFLDRPTVAQRAYSFPEITEQLVSVLLLSYHDISQETKPEYSKENKNIKWKNMKTRWLILHGGFNPDVISLKGFSLTTLWKTIPSIINYSLFSETCSVFFHTTYHSFTFLFFLPGTQTRMSDPWKQCLGRIHCFIPSVESSV